MLAVKFCATALVMQWTRGRRARRRSMVSAATIGSSLCGARISPSAGMTRIRFDGLAFASQPGIGAYLCRAPHEIADELVARGLCRFKAANARRSVRLVAQGVNSCGL